MVPFALRPTWRHSQRDELMSINSDGRPAASRNWTSAPPPKRDGPLLGPWATVGPMLSADGSFTDAWKKHLAARLSWIPTEQECRQLQSDACRYRDRILAEQALDDALDRLRALGCTRPELEARMTEEQLEENHKWKERVCFLLRVPGCLEWLKQLTRRHAAFCGARNADRESDDPDLVVTLGGPDEHPMVHGKTKACLTFAQFNVVTALLDAGDRGLSKKELPDLSGHGDAVNVLKRLHKSDADWAMAIELPGSPGHRYRIKRYSMSGIDRWDFIIRDLTAATA